MTGDGDSGWPGDDADRRAASDGGQAEPGPDEMYCQNCGAVVKRVAEICPSCGDHLEASGGAGHAGGAAGGSATAQTGAGAGAAGTQAAGGDAPKEAPMGRYMAGLLGGLVMLFAGFVVPLLGHVGGGVLAGYLRGPDTKESAIAGGIGGLISSIPLALLFGLFAMFGLIGGLSGGEAAAGGLIVLLIFGGIAVAGMLFYVVLGAIGGAIGAELSDRAPP